MSLGKFQKKGIRYLNSIPHVVCKASPPLATVYYSWHLDDMDSTEYFARMSETESSFIVLDHCGFYRGWNDNKLFTTGGRTFQTMPALKMAVQAILKEIEQARKDRAEYIKEHKAKQITNAAGEFEV